ncbi:J domain-containing protein [Luteibacter sp. PPL201]|uniref:J domain-containing protein n=1 Tax=Luteibacter sahnii TaxID=3021977 RepID=A0ABT6BCN0_9GAMM|nr:J domain-containing protein [Luteibacter sp. PPL193]MDY1549309.1 J domain-containing protein [Luteibacter sp. PPL193]
MTDETDFIALYGTLRVDPQCSLDDFRLAYRRYVSQWHPDRRRSPNAQRLATSRLQRVTAQYDAAIAFQRRHGRLPGAGRVVPPSIPDARRTRPRVDSVRVPRIRWRGWLTALTTGCAAAGTVLMTTLPVHVTESSAPADARGSGAGAAREVVPDLRRGMTSDQVWAIEGEPTKRGGQHWEYGTSWIRFDGDRVEDWYSSPWQPLHVASEHAPR